MDLFKKKAKKQKTTSQQLDDASISFEELPPLNSSKTPPTISELQKQYDRESEILINNPNTTEVDKTALSFLAYGLDFTDFSKANFNVELTFAERDIDIVEQIAGQAHKAYVSNQLPEESLLSYAKMFAGYMGLLILIHKGGEWIAEVPSQKEAGPGISQSDGNIYFVLSKAFRRIQNGSGDNLIHFYRLIEYTL